jgi:hypothetical protein
MSDDAPLLVELAQAALVLSGFRSPVFGLQASAFINGVFRMDCD